MQHNTLQHTLLTKGIIFGMIVLLASIFLFPKDSSATGQIVNPGFETGDFSGWNVNGTAEVVNSYTADSEYGWNNIVGPIYLPKEGSKFAVLKTGQGTGIYTTISQTVNLSAGEQLTGWAAFDAVDYWPYNDDAAVVVVRNGASIVIWSKDVATVGDYGESQWTQWAFTAPYTGVYILELKVRNVRDNILDSYALFDAIAGGTSQPTEFLSEISGGSSLMLRNNPDTSATALKQLPNGWVVYVTNTNDNDGNIMVNDGYRWYQVKDETDGTLGWMVAGQWSNDEFIGDEYLKYNLAQQLDYQNKVEAIGDGEDAVEERKDKIVKSVNHYFTRV